MERSVRAVVVVALGRARSGERVVSARATLAGTILGLKIQELEGFW